MQQFGDFPAEWAPGCAPAGRASARPAWRRQVAANEAAAAMRRLYAVRREYLRLWAWVLRRIEKAAKEWRSALTFKTLRREIGEHRKSLQFSRDRIAGMSPLGRLVAQLEKLNESEIVRRYIWRETWRALQFGLWMQPGADNARVSAAWKPVWHRSYKYIATWLLHRGMRLAALGGPHA